MAASTFAFGALRMICSPLITRDTVLFETPACFATSLMVGALRCRLELLGSMSVIVTGSSPASKQHPPSSFRIASLTTLGAGLGASVQHGFHRDIGGGDGEKIGRGSGGARECQEG